MFRVVGFGLEDIKPLLNEPMNHGLRHWAKEDYAYVKHLERNSLALTGLVDDVPVICVFVVELWNNRGYVVALLSEKIREHSVSVYRGIKKFLSSIPYDRLEFDSPCGFTLGDRRAEFLGFDVMVKRARKYLPNGGDATLYEWVRA